MYDERVIYAGSSTLKQYTTGPNDYNYINKYATILNAELLLTLSSKTKYKQ